MWAQRAKLAKLLSASDQMLNGVLQPGRFVKVCAEGADLGWGVVIQQTAVGGRQFFDVLIPGLTAADVDARGAEPLTTLVETPEARVSVGELATGLGRVLAADATYSGPETVEKEASATAQEALDRLIFGAGGLGLSEEDKTATWCSATRERLAKRRIDAGEVSGDDVLRLGLAGLLRDSQYLKDSKSARELLNREELATAAAAKTAQSDEDATDALWSRAGLKACVVRTNLAGISGISSKFMKALPTSLARGEDRRQLVGKFVQLVQLLLGRELEALVREAPELRGARLAEALFARAGRVFSFYDLSNVAGIDPEAVAQQQRVLALERLIAAMRGSRPRRICSTSLIRARLRGFGVSLSTSTRRPDGRRGSRRRWARRRWC